MTNAQGRLPIRFTTSVSGPTFETALEQAQAAEAAGFSSVSFMDRPHDPILDGWTLATAIAARTERIRFYHTTLNIPFRFPAVLAKEAATLDIISHGRLDLCLGAGGEGNRALYDSIGVPLGEPGERLRALREYIDILRGLWANEKFTYEGRIYKVEDAEGGVKPVQESIPIWVGARLPLSLKLAGEKADGFLKNQGWTTPEEMREFNTAIDRAARQADRFPNLIRRIINGFAFVRGKDDTDPASEMNTGIGGYSNQGLIGTVPEILDIIRAYRGAGVDTFSIRFPAGHVLEQIHRFGAEVIPEAAKL